MKTLIIVLSVGLCRGRRLLRPSPLHAPGPWLHPREEATSRIWRRTCFTPKLTAAREAGATSAATSE